MTFRFSPRPNRAAEIRWRPWGDKAFQEAQVADKPVLLAISAVWCHWCHVMDETSYSDPEVIRLINERYVPVRVDNDERPDVNRRYNMGGWPTTAFLTPDGEIVHGGTYVPPDAMRSYLTSVADLWSTQRSELAHRVAEMREKESEARAPKSGDLSSQIVDQVGSLVRGQYDPQFGGFGPGNFDVDGEKRAVRAEVHVGVGLEAARLGLARQSGKERVELSEKLVIHVCILTLALSGTHC